MVVLRNPTTGPRIVPFQEDRLGTDVLSNGHPAFRVSQKFSLVHDGLDIANFSCGDILLASVAGEVRNRTDDYGAIICEIWDSPTTHVGYGHLSRLGRPTGYRVKVGEVIGYVGNTGKNIGGCHCHYSRFDSSAPGAHLDPWPLLEQNQQTLPDTGTGGPDVYEWIPAMGHQNVKYAVVSRGTRLLKNPDGTLHYQLPNDQRLEVIGGLIDGKQFWVGRRPKGDGLFLIPGDRVLEWLKG